MVNCIPWIKINPTHLADRYFSSVFTQEDPNTAPSYIAAFHIDKSDDVSLSSINITPSIVFDKLVSLKTGKSPGPDGWPAEVFKQCADQPCVPCLFFSSNPWQVVYFQKIGKLVT